MNKQFFSLYLLLALFTGVFTSCQDDSSEPATPFTFQQDLLVVNKGNFSQGNGSLTWLPEGETMPQQDAYRTINGSAIGGIIENVRKIGDKLYIVTNVGDKIIVADAATLEKQGEITSAENLTTPRYLVVHGNKAYVSVWGPYTDPETNDYSLKSSKLAIIDLATQQIEATIAVPSEPEGMQVVGDKLFIAHASDSLSVVNLSTRMVEEKVATAATGASLMVIDAAGKLWVAHSGGWGSTEGHLVQYNPSTLAEEKRITIPVAGPNGKMQLVGNVLYFATATGLHKVDLGAAAASPEQVVAKENLGTFWVDETSGELYLGISDSANPGTLLVLDAKGAEQQSFQLGAFPHQILKM